MDASRKASLDRGALLALFLAASALAAPVTEMGRVEGRVILSPAAPVQRMGELKDRPFKGHFVIVNDSGTVVAQVDSNDRGVFQVALKPGRYTIRMEPASVIGRVEKGELIVRAGKITKTIVIYDAGIR